MLKITGNFWYKYILLGSKMEVTHTESAREYAIGVLDFLITSILVLAYK